MSPARSRAHRDTRRGSRSRLDSASKHSRAAEPQASEKRRDFRSAHGRWMTLAVMNDQPPNPRHVCVLGPAAVVSRANRIANAIEKLRLAALHDHCPNRLDALA